MKSSKRKRLERAGFKVGTVQDFLDLSDEEMALIELKVRLVEMLKSARKTKRITQHDLAKLMASSQSRVAKIEGTGADVSLDLICKALFALGVSRQAIGRALASKRAA
jgi:ribosome-binding protein aMBF1 (putative translation factor)